MHRSIQTHGVLDRCVLPKCVYAFVHIHLEGYFSIHLSAIVPLDELIVYHSARETGEEMDRERGREDGEDRGRRTEKEDAVEDNI